jgi:hypothetical protein
MAWSPLMAIFTLPGGFQKLYDLFVVAHYPVGFVGAYWLAREIGASRASASIAAMIFALGGPLISMNNLLPTFESAIFGPFALAAAIRVARSPALPSIALLGLFLGLHVEGADPAFLLCDVVIFAVAAWPHLRARSPKTIGALAIGGALGASLAAIQLIPLLELLQGTPRGSGFGNEIAQGFSVTPFALLDLVMPGVLGDFANAHTLFSGDPAGRLYLASLYLGAASIPLVLLLPKGARRWWIALGVFVVLALGRYTPLHGLLLDVLPWLRASRFPVKLAYGIAICWTASSAIALEELSKGAVSMKRSILIRAGGGTLFFALVVLVLMSARPSWVDAYPPVTIAGEEEVADLLRSAGSQALCAALIAAALVIFWSTGRVASDRLMLLFAAVLGADLALAARPILITTDSRILDRPPIADVLLADDRSPSVLLYSPLKSPPGLPNPTNVEQTAYNIQRLETGTGAMLGVRYFFDGDVNEVRPRDWRMVTEALGRSKSEAERLALLGRMGTSHVLVEATRTDVPGLQFLGRAPVEHGPPISAFRIEHHRRYVSLAHRVVQAASLAEALETMTSTRVAGDLDSAVIEDRELERIDPRYRALSSTSAVQGAVGIRERGDQELQLHVVSARDAILIVAQRYSAGWTAEIDGKPARPIAVEAVLTGLPIPSGEHAVRISYRPKSFLIGAIVSALSSLAIACLLWIGRAQARGLRMTNSISSNPPT